MHLVELRLHDFRNFSDLVMFPHPEVNVVLGKNGAGKSSFLESIYMLGYGRSFRTNKPNMVINHNARSDQASIFAKYMLGDSIKQVGLSRHKADGFLFNDNGVKTNKLIDVVRNIPVQLFTPQTSDLVIGAPLLRRRFVDWLVFHVKHSFHSVSSNYNQSLLQRNALLRSFAKNVKAETSFLTQDVWRNELIKAGNSISLMREELILDLEAELNTLYRVFKPEINIEIRYNRGWDASMTFEEALHTKTSKDLLNGYTSIGPHKADLKFIVDGKVADEFLSRGQLRVLVSLLLIAEVNVLKRSTNKNSIFLIDDLGAELDPQMREFLVSQALNSSSQLYITAIEKSQVENLGNYNNKKVFHVEHNRVAEE